MAKLHCKNHGKRCLVLHPGKVVRHRSGEGFCDSTEVVYAGKTLPKALVTAQGVAQPYERAVKLIADGEARAAEEPKRKSRKKRGK